MTENPKERAIQDFLVQELLYDKGLTELKPEESLLESGLLDSIAIMRIVSFCEEAFGVSIPDEDVLPENLETVRSIAKLVERSGSSR